MAKKKSQQGGSDRKRLGRSAASASLDASAKSREAQGHLTARARKAVDEAISLAKTMFDIDVDTMSPADVHRRIQARSEPADGREMKISDVSTMGSVLSVVWAEAISRELGWAWTMVDGVAAIVSASRSHVVYPVTYFCNGIARGGRGFKPEELYGTIKSGALPAAEAGAMVVVA
jgi:hypothetical protein